MQSPARAFPIVLISLALIAIAQPNNVFAQTASTTAALPKPSPVSSQAVMGAPFLVGPHNLASIPGEPYSAEETQERYQTLGDGTHITQTTQTLLYRDSQGRTRRESSPSPMLVGSNPHRIAYIYDPATRVHIVLDLTRQIARRHTMPVKETRPQAAPQADSPDQSSPQRPVRPSAQITPAQTTGPSDGTPRRAISSASLGKQTIEGVETVGVQTTVTIPPGAQGNDREMQVVCENWRSPELKLTMLSKCTDPLQGDHTTRIVSIDRSEPDPSLFEIPAGFAIEDEEMRVVRDPPANMPEPE